jgi:hypothetical protein
MPSVGYPVAERCAKREVVRDFLEGCPGAGGFFIGMCSRRTNYRSKRYCGGKEGQSERVPTTILDHIFHLQVGGISPPADNVPGRPDPAANLREHGNRVRLREGGQVGCG